MNNSANSCHWSEAATHWAALPLIARWPRKDQTGSCSVQAGSVREHLAIWVSLSDCQSPSSWSWVALLEAGGTLENQHDTPFYYLKAPMGSHGEATAKIKTPPWQPGCPGNLLAGFTTPAVSIHASPRRAAHSRNQPGPPHSATRKQGGIRPQSRTAVCRILLDNPRSDREHFARSLQKYSTSRERPSLLRKGEQEIKSSKQASKHSAVFPAYCRLLLHERVLLLLLLLHLCFTFADDIKGIVTQSTLRIECRCDSLTAWILDVSTADGNISPRRQTVTGGQVTHTSTTQIISLPLIFWWSTTVWVPFSYLPWHLQETFCRLNLDTQTTACESFYTYSERSWEHTSQRCDLNIALLPSCASLYLP